MSYEFVSPLTPPRIAKPKAQIPKSPVFQTPVTPKRPKDILKTPHTNSNLKNGLLSFTTPGSCSEGKLKPPIGLSLLPITPEFTPRKSPRRQTRKRKTSADEIFMHTDSLNKDSTSQFGLFLPNPSTIGSGRKVTIHNKTPKATDINLDGIASFQVKNDYENINKKDEMDVIATNSESSSIPNTPKLSIINEDLVNHWHGKSFNNTYSSDEDDTEVMGIPITKKALRNPFISNLKEETTKNKNTIINTFNPFIDNQVDNETQDKLRTHIEYVNNVTGEKKMVKMSPRQALYKPKKLDFSQFRES